MKIQTLAIFFLVLLIILVTVSILVMPVLGKLFDWQWTVPDVAKHRVETFLAENFDQEMVVDKYLYISFSRDYLAWVYLKDQSEVRFKIQLYEDGDISHNYYEAYWEKQANEIVKEILWNISFDVVNVRFMLQTFQAPSFSPPYTNEIYSKYAPLYDHLPDYPVVQNEVKARIQIDIQNLGDFDEDNDTQYEGVLTAVKALRDEILFSELFFWYSDVFLEIHGEDVQMITDLESLRARLSIHRIETE